MNDLVFNQCNQWLDGVRCHRPTFVDTDFCIHHQQEDNNPTQVVCVSSEEQRYARHAQWLEEHIAELECVDAEMPAPRKV
jgi:hypothetical protein